MDDAYNGQTVLITGGTGAGQSRIIEDYDGIFHIASMGSAPWVTPPDATSDYDVIPEVYIFAGAKHGVTLRVTEGELGVMIEPSINHIFARGFFFATVDGSDVEPVYNPETLIFTVALDTSEKVTVITSTNRTSENPTTLSIRIPDAEMHYITPGTVTGIASGALVRTALGGLARDDSERLREIAALARA